MVLILLIDNPFVGPTEITFGLTKFGKLLNDVPHNVISANQKAESFVYRWLLAHAMLNGNVLSRIRCTSLQICFNMQWCCYVLESNSSIKMLSKRA